MDGREDSPASVRSELERDTPPSDARTLMADWLSLTDRLLGELALSVAELQELVAMQGRINELVERSSTERLPGDAEGERPSFRRVL